MFQNPRNFIVTSDYPMDYIVWSENGSMSTEAHKQDVKTIPHGLGFSPLLFGIYSIDNGQTWTPFGPEAVGFYTFIESDSTNSYVHIWTKSSDVSILYKIWGYMPDGVHSVVNPPVSESSFVVNSDYNYSKLLATGVWDAEVGNNIVLFEHNLGYIPQVMLWVEYQSGIVGDSWSDTSSDLSEQADQYVYVDKNKLYATYTDLDSGGDLGIISKIHFRIYANEVGGSNG